MAQTTGAISGKDLKIEVSSDGSTWTNISGSANSVNPGEQTRMTGETYTGDGAGAIITSGKREPMEVEVRIVYTETSGEAFATVKARHESADGSMYLRYSPKGGQTGEYQYTSATGDGVAAAGIVSGFTYPETDAGSGDPILAGFKLKVPALLQAAVA